MYVPVALGLPGVLSVLSGPGRTLAAIVALVPAAGAVVAGIAWHRPAERRGWALVATAAATLTVGNTALALTARAGQVVDTSWVTALPFLGSTVPLACGVWLLARRGAGRDRWALVDALTVAVSGALLAWSLVLAPQAAASATTGATDPAIGYAISFPAADLLVLGLALRLAFADGARNASRVLLVSGLLALTTADVAFSANVLRGAHVLGSWSDVLWLLGYALIGSAALHPSAGADDERADERAGLPTWRLALVGVALLTAPVTLVTHAAVGDHVPIVEAVCAVVIAVLVLVRLVGALRRVEHQAAELTTLARTDPLTGAQNRRALDERLSAELERARRTGAPLSVALLDLDHFKRYNDSAGHLAGDRLLRRAVGAWSARLRASDVLARYGGEEFAVVLPDCDVDASWDAVERVRTATPSARTCSAGVATWDGVEDLDELLERVDIALYAAKRRGRDRTIVAGEPVPSGAG